MRAVPMARPCISNTRPNAIAEAMPEQNTKISVASEKPKRAGIQLTQLLPGVCAMKMMNIATPRKKSRRGSRLWAAALKFSDIILNLDFADDDAEAVFMKRC